MLLIDRAATLTDLHRYSEAHADIKQAVRGEPSDCPSFRSLRISALRVEGRLFLAEEQPELALAPLKEALERLSDQEDLSSQAEVRFLLAKTLALTGGSTSSIREHASQSLTYYKSVSNTELVDELEKLLASLNSQTPGDSLENGSEQ